MPHLELPCGTKAECRNIVWSTEWLTETQQRPAKPCHTRPLPSPNRQGTSPAAGKFTTQGATTPHLCQRRSGSALTQFPGSATGNATCVSPANERTSNKIRRQQVQWDAVMVKLDRTAAIMTSNGKPHAALTSIGWPSEPLWR
jgi:hypothetical protein